MSKTFRAWDVDQAWLLPPSVHDFVAPGHVAHFVRDTVREGLDLSAIFADYDELRGQPPYHPAMMVALLLYGYSRGVYASRKLAQACEERVDFMALTGLQKPDFHTINDFRKRHLTALGGLFVQVLKLCAKAGLVKLGHVALDGTKLKASASRHKAMSYGRMKQAEATLEVEIAAWFAKAEAEDRADDERHGKERRGDEMPQWVADKEKRLARIRQARAQLEAEAKQPSAALDPEGPGPSSGMRKGGRDVRAPEGSPPPKAQRNFTDPDSRIQPTAQGFIAGYNGQIAVDGAHQIIVAQRLTASPADHDGLVKLVDQAKANLGRPLRELSADAGFASEANLEALAKRGIKAYVAPGRTRHGDRHSAGKRKLKDKPLMAAMARKLKRAGRRSRYRLRKGVVEPVFGQIKQARGFRQFLLRSLDKVRDEWSLLCTAHNLLKLANASNPP